MSDVARADLGAIAAYLDDLLRIAEIPDEPNAWNGLQVANRGSVGFVVAAVDASQATIDGVVARTAEVGAPALVLVHHGLFWDGHLPITQRRYRRLAPLLANDVALYSAHIPLDVHPELGNNAILARELGLTHLEPFDTYKGVPFGFRGRAPAGLTRETLVSQVNELLGTRARLIAGGPPGVSRVGVITGGAGSRIGAARLAGLDMFITGEGSHHTYFDAMEYGVNVIYAGHYATEQVGVKALAANLGSRFGLPWEFHDHPTGL